MRATSLLILLFLLASPAARAEPTQVCEPAVATCVTMNEVGDKRTIAASTCPVFWCTAAYAERKPDDWLACAWAPIAGGACVGQRTIPPVHDPFDPAGCQFTWTLLCLRTGSAGSTSWIDAKSCVGGRCEYVLLQASPTRTSCGPTTGEIGQTCGYYSEIGLRDSGVCKYDTVLMRGHYHCVGTATIR